jgi:lysophospholipase L1-like esterase
MPRHSSRLVALGAAALLVTAALVGCGGSAESRGTQGPSGTPSTSAPSSTPELDSVVVLGHSGTTGYASGANPDADVRENSWATGTNPEVASIYQRLLATHPALEGHTQSLGVDGSTVDDLVSQTQQALAVDPLPDLVLIQTIDNDIRCDGTDPDNYQPFADTLEQVLATIEEQDEGAQVFFVGQWGSVEEYTTAISRLPSAVAANQGTGPCDVFTPEGKRNPKAEAYLQQVVDAYFARIADVCSRHAQCWTDEGAMQTMTLAPADLTDDHNHLTVRGQRRMAEIVWAALPDDIKQRS